MRHQKQHQRRSQTVKAQFASGLSAVVRQTVRLWRRHHLTYDQTEYIVERVRHELDVQPPTHRRRTVHRLDRNEVERLVNTAYQDHSQEGLLIKTLFLTGARVSEFVHLRVEDLFLNGDPPQIHITHAKGNADRYVPVLPALAQELHAHLENRRRGWLFESNRQQRYAVRSVQAMVRRCALRAGIGKRVYPHLLRHSIATILLDSGQVPIDQVQKFLGHLHLSTTQIYAETSLRALGDNYIRALTGAATR
jgi:integrase/recombinase XerD